MKLTLALLAVFGLAWFAPSLAEATTLNAASCSYTDVNTQVTAAVTGDTVTIPAGTCTWATVLVVGSKSIVIQGAGAGDRTQCADGGQHTYTCIIQDTSITSYLILWATITGGSPRLTAFTISTGTGLGTIDDNYGVIQMGGTNGDFRLDHVNIYQERTSRSGSAFASHGYLRGVLDHNIFQCGLGGANGPCIMVFHENWTGLTPNCDPLFKCGDYSWSTATGLGTREWLFIEDNTVINKTSYPYCSDGWSGGRVVWRYNTQVNCVTTNHGLDSTGRARGGRAYEYYGNACSFTFATDACHGQRGGTLVAWGNRVTGGTAPTRLINIVNYRLWVNRATQCAFFGCSDTYVGDSHGSTVEGSGGCCNSWDYGTGTATGYPAMDQMGRGVGDLLSGSVKATMTIAGASTCHNADPDACWPHQIIEPVYGWLNRFANGTNGPLERGSGPIAYLTEQRDYYTERWTGISNNFDGTATPVGTKSGVGVGIKDAMTASNCVSNADIAGTASVDGQAWWVTDEGNWATGVDSTGVDHAGTDGQLYKCTATNTWTLYYTPFTYPHPLVTAAPPEPEPPTDAPTGLRLVGATTSTSVCLAWNASSLASLGGYHVYHGLTSGAYSEVFSVLLTRPSTHHSPATQYCYTTHKGGTHYFSVSAHTQAGVDTALATEVSATFTALARATASARSGR